MLPVGQSLKERGSSQRGPARDNAEKVCDHPPKGYDCMRRSQSAEPSHYLKVKWPFWPKKNGQGFRSQPRRWLLFVYERLQLSTGITCDKSALSVKAIGTESLAHLVFRLGFLACFLDSDPLLQISLRILFKNSPDQQSQPITRPENKLTLKDILCQVYIMASLKSTHFQNAVANYVSDDSRNCNTYSWSHLSHDSQTYFFFFIQIFWVN